MFMLPAYVCVGVAWGRPHHAALTPKICLKDTDIMKHSRAYCEMKEFIVFS